MEAALDQFFWLGWMFQKPFILIDRAQNIMISHLFEFQFT